jgi:hypothetical protein
MPLAAPPDTMAARSAAELVNEASNAALVGHVWRTWHFGHRLISEHVAGADLEAAYVAAMLHDLGLTERFDADEDFELAGAAAAADSARLWGWEPDRVALTASAIASHLDLTSAEARPEIALVHLGAGADVVGLRVDELPGDFVDEVLAAHPRDGFSTAVLAALTRQVDRRPASKIAVLFREFGFANLVRACPLDHR